jgi:hypothetical protein
MVMQVSAWTKPRSAREARGAERAVIGAAASGFRHANNRTRQRGRGQC